MPSIKNTDLLTKLHAQTDSALRSADGNRSGVVSSTELANVPEHLKAEVQSYRSQAGTVGVTAFVSAFDNAARSAVTAADSNRDGTLTTTEQTRLPTWLKDNVDKLWGTAPAPTPTTPTTPTPSTTGNAFGISGSVPASRVTMKPIVSSGLSAPTGIAFNPRTGSLWIVNRGDDSSVVVDNPGKSTQRATKYRDDSAHFMNNPTAISFSPTREEFATVQETENDYNGGAHGNHFMGPTLWTSNRANFEGGTNSHLDMVHHSPNSMGIAHGEDGTRREYWVFNGQSGSIDRYWFNAPHALGAHDHADGQTLRYAAGELKRVAGVPGHVVYDAATKMLYVADTGNGRIAKLDTKLALTGVREISGHHDETPLYSLPSSHVSTFAAGLGRPSGLVMYKDQLIVADNASGKIHVFDKAGAKKGEVDTGLGAGALGGLAVSPVGKLYVADMKRHSVVELQIR